MRLDWTGFFVIVGMASVLASFHFWRARRTNDPRRSNRMGVASIVHGLGWALTALDRARMTWIFWVGAATVLAGAFLMPRRQETFDAISRRAKRSE